MVPKFRVFISSPTDVDRERQRAQRVIERLNGEFAHVAQLEAIRWETRFYSAHKSFQEEIPEASDCDVVISIFWTRIGSALPDDFPRMPPRWPGDEGESYPSGSAYETLTAIAARTQRERPDVYVFRKTAPPLIEIDRPQEVVERQEQWQRLEAFFQRWFRTPDGKFLSAYHTFRSPDEFELAVEQLLRDWVKTHVPGAAAIVWPIATLGSPFRGLAAFDARHAPVYFGRDLKVSSAIDRLKAAAEGGGAEGEGALPAAQEHAPQPQRKPFLLIVGPSGSGKSSLARAGVAPRLTAPGVVSTVDLWRTAVMRPSDHASPFRALADALYVKGADDDAGGFGRALPELAQGDLPTPERLAETLAKAEPGAAAPLLAALDKAAAEEAARGGFERTLRASLLLTVDQLEDIFGADVADADRAAFAVLLSHLATTQRIWIVATLRGDLYQRLIAEPAFLALKDAGATCDLPPPRAEELEEIVRRSAAAAGLVYETDPATGARLDDTLLEDAEGQDVLPLLQFTLNQLFERRAVREDGKVVLTFEAYRRMGGLDGAIDQAAEAAIAALGETEVAGLPRLLRRLAVPLHDRTAGGAGPLALTVHPVPLDAVTATPETRRLVEALVESRVLLLSGGEAGTPALVRVAHQRVFESWQRARGIVEDHRDFYRIREEIEQQHERWSNGQHSRALLIPPGRALAEAEDVVANYGDDLRPVLHAFVLSSGRRARLRQTLLGLAAVAFAIVAAVATVSSIQARRAEDSAEANYRTARGTVDSLIGIIAGGLRDLQGVSIKTVDTALVSIDGIVDRLAKSAAKNDPTFDATRAAMLYEFAKTYQRSKQAKALEMAEESLRYRRELARKLPRDSELQYGLAASLEQIGDLTRYQDREGARKLYEEAHSIRLAHYQEDPGSDRWAAGVSQVLVRLGDLDGMAKRWSDALASYDRALAVSIDMHLRKPDDAGRLRELSWTFNKIGDVLLAGAPSPDPAGALDRFDKALCIRRRLAAGQAENVLWRADVSWTLDRIGRARRALHDLAGADDAFLEAWSIRNQISADDPRNTRALEDLYLILSRVADHKLDMGEPRFAYAFYLGAEKVMSSYRLLAEEPVLRKRRDADAIIRDPHGREPAARGRLSPEDAQRVEKSPDAVMLSEKARIAERRTQLQAGREASCLAELTDGLRRTAARAHAPE
jgi:tetratricopeptide (TPR) repeat protein